jgi:hypothetical protein
MGLRAAVDPDARGRLIRMNGGELDHAEEGDLEGARLRTRIATSGSAICETCEPSWLTVSAAQRLRKSRMPREATGQEPRIRRGDL